MADAVRIVDCASNLLTSGRGIASTIDCDDLQQLKIQQAWPSAFINTA
jgi:hypothetical protein